MRNQKRNATVSRGFGAEVVILWQCKFFLADAHVLWWMARPDTTVVDSITESRLPGLTRRPIVNPSLDVLF
jgi:hypothetical protein